jgi:hypothetical protein
MGKNRRITIEVAPAVARDLETLLKLGLFGPTLELVAEGLLLAEIRRLAAAGWLPHVRLEAR